MRVWKATGRKPWRVRGVDADGQRVQRSFETKALADEYDRREEEKKARRRAGLPVEHGPTTFNELADLFLENQPAKKSDRWFSAMLKHTRDRFGGTLVRELRSEEYGRWLHALPKSAKTKTSILSTARQVMKAGVEWGYLERNPLRPGAVNGPGTKRVRPIQPFEDWSEVEAVARELEKGSRLVKFIALTGLRPGEATALHWFHWIAVDGYLTVPGTKTTAAARVIPLSKPARELLAELPQPIDTTLPIFDLDWDDWRDHHWYKALDAAGLDRRPPYELRHTFATLALERGVPIETLSKLLGHTDIAITLRYYAKFTRRKLEQDVALLDNITQTDSHLRATK